MIRGKYNIVTDIVAIYNHIIDILSLQYLLSIANI
jgi:hypothetical protein